MSVAPRPHSRSSEYASLFEPTVQIAAPHLASLPEGEGWSMLIRSPVVRPNQRRIFAPFFPWGRRVGDEGR